MGLNDWFAGVIDYVFGSVVDFVLGRDSKKDVITNIERAFSPESAQQFYDSANETVKNDPEVIQALANKKEQLKLLETQKHDPFTEWVDTAISKAMSFADKNDPAAKVIDMALESWIKDLQAFDNLSPEESRQKISLITARMLELFAGSAAIDIALGAVPTLNEGEASSRNTKELIKALGFGAVLAAVAHDPVKIGLLRPYQDNLEATFRNKRPDHVDILNGYKQRSLSETVITNIDEITDPLMDKIEDENNIKLYEYMAQHGYRDSWIKVLQDASTKALTFGNLSSMAKMGHYNRQLAIFSLWTYGLDRRLMYASLDALDTMRDVGLWKGFRSMVEPSYVQGLIDADDLKEYWSRILVPGPVQEWALLRLTKAREKFAAKEASTGLNKQRDLTRSDFTKAYLESIIDLAAFEAKLKQLGYDPDEISVIVKLTDNTKKTPASTKCKRLSLSDYELAHKNGILTTDQVIARLQGEYCDADIDIEKQLLALDDLTAEAPIRERDLSVGEITIAYVDGLMTRDRMISYLHQIGYDDEETVYLAGIADIKKEIADAKAGKAVTAGTVQKERDLTLAQLTSAYVQNVIDENTYTADLASLGYDNSEVSILLKLAQIKKKLPTVTGLKRLPLSDYEKAQAYGLVTDDDVLQRMRGEYSEFDIGLEKMMLAQGIARKG